MTLQETIIAQLGVKPSIDPKEEIRKSIDFLKAYMLKHPFLKTYVLGISGGQDSTLAGRLAQLAIEELRAETGKDYQFIAIRLPYGVQADEDDAQRALAFIKPDVSLVVNIKEAVGVPIIASGGAGNIEDIVEVFEKTTATGALAASIFHFGEVNIGETKQVLANAGIEVRR